VLALLLGLLQTVFAPTAALAAPEVTPGAALPSPAPVVQQRRYARRAEIGVEFAPGVAIPLKRYLDFGSGQDRYTMENGAGFGFGLALTLNHFELRWTYARLSAGQVQGHLPETLVQPIQQYLGKTINPDLDVAAPGPLIIHNISAGYRVTFAPTPRFHLALPIGLGLVISSPPSFGLFSYDLFGLAAHVGLLAEYTVGRFFSFGGDLRCAFNVTEADPNLGAAGIAATKKVFENSVAWVPLLSVGVHVRVHY